MNKSEGLDFSHIAAVIEYIRENFRDQPTLDDIASKVCLASDKCQYLFTAWSGVGVIEFMKYISVKYAREVLKEDLLSGKEVKTRSLESKGLHSSFIEIEEMTPSEYKDGGKNISINYSFAESLFGEVVVASTPKGVCYMAFVDDQIVALANIRSKFPNANYFQMSDYHQQNALSFFSDDQRNGDKIKLHLKGTSFQLKVWEALLQIPMGKLTTYGNIALKLNNPNASRAVGTAIGNNPVSLLIPCHRVICSSGELGGYHWGLTRKVAIIGWEAAQNRD